MSETAYETLMRTIATLPKEQRKAFDRVCINQDGGISKRTAEPLIKLGLIRSYEQKIKGWPPMTITRYGLDSWAVHMAWCAVCGAEHEARRASKKAKRSAK